MWRYSLVEGYREYRRHTVYIHGDAACIYIHAHYTVQMRIMEILGLKFANFEEAMNLNTRASILKI